MASKEELINNVLIDINNQDIMEKAIATQYGPQSHTLADEQTLKKHLISMHRSQWVKSQEAKQLEIKPIPAAIAYESTPKITESGHGFWKKAVPSSWPSNKQESENSPNEPKNESDDSFKPKS